MSKEEPGIPGRVFGMPGCVISQVLDKQMHRSMVSALLAMIDMEIYWREHHGK